MSRTLTTLATLLSVQALLAILPVRATPTPGRVPKVYNALITSNQNLEPSKAYPVYQPVLHDPFFPYQPIYYPTPDFRDTYPALKGAPQPQPPPAAAAASDSVPITNSPPVDSPQPPSQQPEEPQNEEENKVASGPPPPPPNTESPIPLNQFGLPPQVLPLGRIDPAYNGFNQVAPHFSYSYPNFRLYDPYYDPFSWNPYLNLPPVYRGLPNGLGHGIPSFPTVPPREASPPPAAPAPAAPEPDLPSPREQDPSSPPPEPANLNILNFASKDPAIPNVPPPPLPEGGLKTDSE